MAARRARRARRTRRTRTRRVRRMSRTRARWARTGSGKKWFGVSALISVGELLLPP